MSPKVGVRVSDGKATGRLWYEKELQGGVRGAPIPKSRAGAADDGRVRRLSGHEGDGLLADRSGGGLVARLRGRVRGGAGRGGRVGSGGGRGLGTRAGEEEGEEEEASALVHRVLQAPPRTNALALPGVVQFRVRLHLRGAGACLMGRRAKEAAHRRC